MAMLKRILLGSALLAASLAPYRVASAAPAPGVAQFDGTWSVSIVTDSGSCDRGYRYALHIANGRIFYDNPNFNVSGAVNARGQVQVMVGAGSQQAVGTGRLSRDYGTGTWVGRSPTEQCSGHWEAERRPAGSY
jgi:hypothetical protein